MHRKNMMFQAAVPAVLALGLASTTGHAATFTVDALFDDVFSQDDDPGDGICDDTAPGQLCTLRAAIQEANALPGPDRIEFSVAGEIGPESALLGPLPDITDDLVIFGGNAPGASFGGPPVIYLDGAAIDASTDPFAAGLRVTSGNLEVFDLGIVAFPRAGIEFDNGSDGGRVDRVWLGLDDGGNVDAHPSSLSTVGIRLLGSNAVIGKSGPPGSVTGLGNVISGNAAGGIHLLGDNNTVLGNVIGMTLDGLTARGNGGYGIFMFDTADNNRIGSGDPGDDSGNHIANNNLGGMVVDGSSNGIDANTFGFKPGTGVFFNSSTTAIEVAGADHLIGGEVGNRIIDHFISLSGGSNAGIQLGRALPGGDAPATNVIVERNEIGTDDSVGLDTGIRIAVTGSTGNTIRANRIADAAIGIDIAASGNTVTENRVGIDADLGLGAGPGNATGIRVGSSDNLVSFNEIGNSTFSGVVVDGPSNDFIGNDIGFAAGIGDVGNGDAGIRMLSGAVSNLIQGNRIIANGGPGIELVNQNSVAGNTIFGNGIQRNEGIGIDFIEFELGVGAVRGPTENDPGDADAGANRRMNYPEFGEAAPVPGTDPVQTVVTFVVDSDPANQAYPISVDFYRAPGYGEFTGSSFMASAVYDTFGAVETLTLTLPAGIGIDRHFTAVATDADGNTSEFAPARSLGEVLFRDGYED
ncbi:MAG: hypothetical protein CMP07_07635 [Xanthomonadales bacterium]|nr:hypothetical protein [Ahrensia sp.]MBL38266.1 hypothetical protein [Xanthomonadales bacterium]